MLRTLPLLWQIVCSFYREVDKQRCLIQRWPSLYTNVRFTLYIKSLIMDRLQEELRLLRGREVFLREKVLMKEGTWKCIHLDHFTEERDAVLECDICKYDCYLSAVVCPCSPDKVVCLRHSDRISFLFIQCILTYSDLSM